MIYIILKGSENFINVKKKEKRIPKALRREKQKRGHKGNTPRVGFEPTIPKEQD